MIADEGKSQILHRFNSQTTDSLSGQFFHREKIRAAGGESGIRKRVLMLASVASMIDQFNMPNICLLKDMGYEVHVACNFRVGNTCDQKRICTFQHVLEGQGIPWHQWDCPRNVYALDQCVKAYFQLWELTGRYRYEMMHCHSPIGGALARIVAHRRGIPVIYTAHGFHFYRGAPPQNWLLYYPVEKLLARWTDVLITVNKEDYAFARRNLAAKQIYRIPGVGIDTKQFAAVSCERSRGETDSGGYDRMDMRRKVRAQYRIPRYAVLLLSVGELNEGKNHRIVLDVMAKLHNTNVYYLICGQGNLQSFLLAYAKKLGIASRVRIPGYVDDMTAVYAAADIFVFPSKREGMPVALMEAIAAGLPCVVSDVRGNRELVEDRGPEGTVNGRRFRLDHSEELLDALREMIAEDGRVWRDEAACGMQLKKIKQYDIGCVLRRMQGIYAVTAKELGGG